MTLLWWNHSRKFLEFGILSSNTSSTIPPHLTWYECIKNKDIPLFIGKGLESHVAQIGQSDRARTVPWACLWGMCFLHSGMDWWFIWRCSLPSICCLGKLWLLRYLPQHTKSVLFKHPGLAPAFIQGSFNILANNDLNWPRTELRCAPTGPWPSSAACYSCTYLLPTGFSRPWCQASSRLLGLHSTFGTLKDLAWTLGMKLSRCPLVWRMDEKMVHMELSKPEHWRQTACLESQLWNLRSCDLTSLSCSLLINNMQIITLIFMLWNTIPALCQAHVKWSLNASLLLLMVFSSWHYLFSCLK